MDSTGEGSSRFKLMLATKNTYYIMVTFGSFVEIADIDDDIAGSIDSAPRLLFFSHRDFVLVVFL
jgi:hypothetical protein